MISFSPHGWGALMYDSVDDVELAQEMYITFMPPPPNTVAKDTDMDARIRSIIWVEIRQKLSAFG